MTLCVSNPPVQELDRLADALGDSSRRAIYLAVREAAEPLTASEVGATFGLHRTVARGHLERLVESGLLVSSYRHRHEGGRPPKVYRASAERLNLQLPARQYELLATLLLDTLEKFGEAAEIMAQQVGFSFGEKLAGTALGDELQQRVQPLREAGAQLEAQDEAGVVKLELKDCLFREVSGNRPGLVCTLDRALMEGLLSTEATRYMLGEVHRRCKDDDVCRLTFLAHPAEGAPVDALGI